ncbi:MAG: hypothetical protein GC200_02805 [Tepidisphaera sp.]|nr:hypothetical protein [Tepidisphaera sp.]
MGRITRATVGLSVSAALGLALSAGAQPSIVSLGSGGPASISNPQGGVYYVGGAGVSTTAAARWVVNGSSLSVTELAGSNGGGLISDDGSVIYAVSPNMNPQASGNTATGVSPAFSMTPTLVAAPISTGENIGSVWTSASNTVTKLGTVALDPTLGVYGSGSSGGSGGTFLTPVAISPNGRFASGQCYISSYNSSAGTTIALSTFQFRPWVYDMQAGGAPRVLSTPQRTSSNTWRKRNGGAFGVSNDGTVIAGWQEYNVGGTSTTADPDVARPVVWNWNGSSYVMSYLPMEPNANGFPGSISASFGTVHMNGAGTIIVGPAVHTNGNSFIGKWVYNTSTQQWDLPIDVGANLTTPASWLPAAVTSCGVPPRLSVTGMTEDGNTIVGAAVYSTCGSFMSGGFIAQNNGEWTITDWYDYLASQNTPGLFDNYGPVGDNGDPTKGLPKLGYPTAISPDGSAAVGLQGGTQRIVGAVPTFIRLSGTGDCVAPVVTLNPASTTFTHCSTVIFNASAAGTGPISYQWYKGDQPIFDQVTADGSTITGASTFQMRILNGHPSDVGSYSCLVTGACGSAMTTAAMLTVDPTASQIANDTCATAQAVAEGTFTFNPCGAYVDDGFASCAVSDKDAWYQYIPTFTGEARFETCGATYDTVLSVYDGCGGLELACNDNWDSGPGGCTASRSRIGRLAVTQGHPVWVRVGAIGTLFGTPVGSLTISQAPPPAANDECAAATPVDIGSYPFNLAEATSDGSVATCQPTSGSIREVYYSFAPSCDGIFTIQTCGSAITNPILSVLSGCFGNEIACNDNVGSGVTGCSSNQARIQHLEVHGSSPVLIRLAISGTSVPSNASGTLTIIREGCNPDLNQDGVADQGDVDYLINVIAGGDNPTGISGDFNCDGVADQGDVDAIINVIAGGPCPN